MNKMPRKIKSNAVKRKGRKYRYKEDKKTGKLIPYYSKRKKEDDLKIWWWERRSMSKEALMRWSPKIRAKVNPFVWDKLARVDVPPQMLSTKEKIEELALETVGHESELLYLMMFCKRKNQFGVSPVKVCSVKIFRDSQGELRAKFLSNFRLFRYFFWEAKKKR